MAAMNFSRFCTPAQLYLILAGISLITAFFNDFQVITLVANGIFVLIWGWILNWLCSKGLKAISWILVLLPFILFIFTFFFAKDIISNATYEEGDQEGDQEGFREGATGHYQDCYMKDLRTNQQHCTTYKNKKDFDDAKKKREKEAKEAKFARERPNHEQEMADMKAYEERMEASRKRREEIAAKEAAKKK
jgi:energy-coupling factor transporter transmembrane protein EcfT